MALLNPEEHQFEALVSRYTANPESVYNTWFVGASERLKAFRSIRRGVQEVVQSIQKGTFGNDFKGSPLEFVLSAITEQKGSNPKIVQKASGTSPQKAKPPL